MDFETAGIVLAVLGGGDVTVGSGTLVTLMSYALAGPSNEASVAVRDRAVAEARQAMIDEAAKRVMS